ncbi:MAG TPA: thioesterase family protein [Trebonia sp.]|jgi:hypothetical protein|nr:thioesterase family protein [Trebonia sp.]
MTGSAGPGPVSPAPPAVGLPEAYFRPGADGEYEPTQATESPWSSAAQHGGPPTALLAHVIQERHPAPGMRIARITVEFLGTIPRVPLTADSAVIRDGRRIRLVEASLRAGGKPVALARAWQIAVSGEGGIPVDRLAEQPPPPLPPAQADQWFSGFANRGYLESVEWRWVHGSFDRPGGHATTWARPRVPLVAGLPVHPQDLALIVADSANGISGPFDPREWLFVPPAVTVTLHRPPQGQWVCLDATTTLAADGLGSTLGTLSDSAGLIGSVAQPLLVARH